MAGREPDRRWVALVFGLTLLGARAAAATPTVVVLRAPNGDGSWRAAEGRTGDELRAIGLRVEEVRALPTEVPRLLDGGAQAVVRISRANDGARVEIWVADAQAGPSGVALAQLTVLGSEAVATAALRAAEQVFFGVTEAGARASGPAMRAVEEPVVTLPAVSTVASGMNQAPTRTVVIPVSGRAGRTPAAPGAGPDVIDPWGVVAMEELVSAPRPTRAPRSRRVLGFAAQAAALGGPGRVGVLAELALALRVAVSPRLAIEPTLSAAVAPAQVQAPGGSIRVGYVAGEVMLGYAPGRVAARVSPRLSLGGGLAAAWARGQARSPLQGGTDVTAIGVITANAGVAIRVRRRLRLLVGAGIHVLLAPVVVRISGEEVARVGPAVIRGSVGIEWDWSRG